VIPAYRAALAAFRTSEEGSGWQSLPFFRDGSAERLMDRLDTMTAVGDTILPSPDDIFSALRLTPLAQVRVVILGQDPYPTPGDAHGLAFSVNKGVRVPRSLANIFRELQGDLSIAQPSHGHLAAWARQGVLLLNSALSVTAGAAGSHRKLGWGALTDQAITAVEARDPGSVFILWGADAQAKRALIRPDRHLIIESAHPSPLSARRGFFGSHPFSRANAWLQEKGLGAIDWSL
jgi:uracil-DNA glycosylase